VFDFPFADSFASGNFFCSAYDIERAKKDRVLGAIKVIVSQHDKSQRVMPPVQDYEAGAVSKQLLRVVLSYVDYVNRTVWAKQV
jgi:UDP-N-acetylglucosamine 2-epimerase